MFCKIVLSSFFFLALHFVGCLNEAAQVNVKTGDENLKVALVAMPQTEEEKNTGQRENFRGNKKIFQASDEWKVVEPDEIVPAGLHVRMNLQTGVKEAKSLISEKELSSKDRPSREERARSVMKAAMEDALLDQDLDKQKVKDTLGDKENVHSFEEDRISRAELENVLKKLRSNSDIEEANLTDFKSMDEIKREFKDLNIEVKLDSEILSELLSRYSRIDLSMEEKLDIMDSLEYYLHQIDNANMFVDAGGLSLLVRDMNATSDDLKSSSLLVVASAVQSNPHAQVAAIKEGLLELTMMVAMKTSSNIVRSRGIHALSSMLRNFPFAQKKFGDLGGFDFICSLMRNEMVDDRTVIKVISLVTDLLEEQIFTEKDEYLNVGIKKEKLKQYERVQLIDRVMGTEWCLLLPKFLALDDLSREEKVLHAMTTWFDPCRSHFSLSLSALDSLEDRLRNFEGEEEQREFVEELLSAVRGISQRIRARDEL